MDSAASSSSSVPPPPEMLSAAMSLDASHEFELDCSRFDTMTMTPTPSYNSLASHQSHGNGLSRSRCVHNLSALGGSSSSDYSVGSLRQESSYASGPNAGPGWGYFVDTPSR